ncbi:MAG: large conductance mechanosensitive channel protein MscL [Candidatus Dormibacteria bacterium]
MKDFKAFLLRGNLVELATAVVIGVAFNAVIQALVKDLVTPLIAAIAGKPDFSAIQFTVNNSRFLVGDFVNFLVNFVIVAAVLYFLVIKPYTRLAVRPTVEAEPGSKECGECLSSIPVAARRCSFCGQPQV